MQKKCLWLFMPAEAITGMKQTAEREGSHAMILGRGMRIHEKIKLRTENGIIETTPGRVVFNTIVPKELGFQNYSLPKKKMSELFLQCYKKVGLGSDGALLGQPEKLRLCRSDKSCAFDGCLRLYDSYR